MSVFEMNEYVGPHNPQQNIKIGYYVSFPHDVSNIPGCATYVSHLNNKLLKILKVS